MSRHRVAVLASIAAAAVIIIRGFFRATEPEHVYNFLLQTTIIPGTLTIISVSESSLTNQSRYVILPDPFGNSNNYTIQDGSTADEDNGAGIVEISGLPNGRYVITQIQAFFRIQDG